MSFQSQRSNIVLRASMSPLVKPSLMPVKTSPGSDVGSPFGSPALSYKMGAVDVKSAWHGPVQSPHIMRRGPKLWTSVSGRDSSTALEPHSHKCSGLVNGELHCEDWSDSSQFFWRCCIIFFFSLQISRWMVPTMNPSHCSLLQELAARQCSRDLFTHGFRTSKNRWSEIAVHRGCSTCLEEFTTLWNIHFLLHLPYITQILPFTPTAFVLCEVGRVEEDQRCMP